VACFLQLVGVVEGQRLWFVETVVGIAATLLVLNLVLIAGVHLHRARLNERTRKASAIRGRLDAVLADLGAEGGPRDPGRLRAEIGRLGATERPIAAAMLIERLEPASRAERDHLLLALREVGAIEIIVRSTRRLMPWRRALAVRTLGWVGAAEAVPVLIGRLSDRSRHARESAVRALGRIGDARALPELEQLFVSPGRVGAGVVYDALIALGPQAARVFAEALRSPIEPVRVASCFGIAARSDPETARTLLEPLLADESASVRTAAVAALGQVGGRSVPDGLLRAGLDDEATVRNAAAGALGSYDDPRAVDGASGALFDPDRDTAICAAESLVRLSRRPTAGPAAAEALKRLGSEWPVQRALTFETLGAL
jgi:HEAT repeat protein